MKISLQKTKSLIAAFLVLFSMVGIFSGCSDSENISSEQIKNPPQPVVSNQQTDKQEISQNKTQETPPPNTTDKTDKNSTENKPKPESNSTSQAPSSISGNLTAHFLNVGQADSTFIELPNKQCLLIDAGNKVNGSQVVQYIKNLGYQKIDFVVATHPHADHIGGMAEVISKIKINKFFMPKKSHTSATFENMLTALKNANVGINTAKAGVNILNIPNLRIDILAPNSSSYDNLNNYSAVVKIKFKNNSFLFMGDAEDVSENEIQANVSANVLKVGHHGSSSSSNPNFIAKVAPSHAIISCGKDNSYGHPHDKTLTTLTSKGAQLYRTDECGTVIVTSNGQKITVNKKASAIKPNAPPKATVSNNKKPSNPTSPSVQPPKKQNTSKPATSTVQPPKKQDNSNSGGEAVFVTKSGTKYHRGSCSSLKKSKIQISLSSARGKYEPCQKCNPPR